MDEIKLTKWKERFTDEVKAIEPEYDALCLETPFSEACSIRLDESDEWELAKEGLPVEIKNRLAELLQNTKPEDSV